MINNKSNKNNTWIIEHNFSLFCCLQIEWILVQVQVKVLLIIIIVVVVVVGAVPAGWWFKEWKHEAESYKQQQ